MSSVPQLSNLTDAEISLILEHRAAAEKAVAAKAAGCPWHGHDGAAAAAPSAATDASTPPMPPVSKAAPTSGSGRASPTPEGSSPALGAQMRRSKEERMMDPLNYADYLSLNSIIGPDSQKLKSTEAGFEAHDEHLFIVIHQTCVAVCRLRARPHIPPFAHLLSPLFRTLATRAAGMSCGSCKYCGSSTACARSSWHHPSRSAAWASPLDGSSALRRSCGFSCSS